VPKVSDAHRAEKRAQILEGARRAFARYGYAGATVVRLEQEIGLSRGAIFSYFPDKWSLFYALAEADHARIGELWLAEGFGAVIRLMASENPDWLGVYFELTNKLRTDPVLREQWAQRNPELSEQLSARVKTMQQNGELRQDLPADALGQFLGLVLDGVVLQITAGYPPDPDALLKLVSAAIAPQ
jgi:AcrR family transcriptional regulator